MSGLTFARKILRANYFSMTLENDYCKFVRICHKCQVHSDLMQLPPQELNDMSPPWPFVVCGMDVIGPIETTASNRHKNFLVSIDYFTKWVEAASYKSVTEKVVANFVNNNLICRFGVPESIIIDNGANLNIQLMRDIYVAICSVVLSNDYQIVDWSHSIFASIWNRAVIPVEVEIPSLRIIQEAGLSNAEWVSKRVDHLTLIVEKRMIVICHGQHYRQRMIRAFHKRVKAIIFEIGHLVLKHIIPHQDEYTGKLTPNWQGPYMVRKVLFGDSLIMSEMDGTA
ncbi:uncharacterized protein [Solanum lycopersicum]|uniref:uncharacterized protein n=1 Tax=Solanum lycopersicum TaxID=4081 RepID=UPI003747D581